MVFHLLLQVIVHQALLHQFTDHHFDVSALLKKAAFVLMDLNLIVFDQLEKLSLVDAFFRDGSVSLIEPLGLAFDFLE